MCKGLAENSNNGQVRANEVRLKDQKQVATACWPVQMLPARVRAKTHSSRLGMLDWFHIMATMNKAIDATTGMNTSAPDVSRAARS